MIVVALLCFGIAGGATLCARLTRRDRNYYPMQKVIWTAFGFTFGGSGAANLLAGRGGHPALRLLFLVVLFLAVLYAAFFIRKRNRTPRYIALDVAGQAVPVDEERLRWQCENVTSVIWHGAAPEEWVRGMEEACAEWRRLAQWRDEGLPGQLAARRRAKGRPS